MKTLFEFGVWTKISHVDRLKALLIKIWTDRNIDLEERLLNEEEENYQPFLRFDGDSVRANNYVGFIQTENELIEIYPKVFRHLDNLDKNLMLRHIFYWFSYCRKWRFPFSQASLDNRYVESFPELIIHLIANQFFNAVASNPLMQYQQVEESLITPRGSINFKRYASNSMARGNYHFAECDYEPFVFDNKVNRIIKYCTRILLDQTKYSENQRLLQEVIFVLDDVEDHAVSLSDATSVRLNSFYDDYNMVMQMCSLVLSQQIYSNKSYDMSQWCLLFPMEYVFEDFIAGFIERHFSSKWKVEYQKSDEYLSTRPKAFNLQHDIFLTSKDGRRIIVDTKYKLRYPSSDVKQGIEQSDLYQVVSYAFRRGCDEVLLIYPNVDDALRVPDDFEIPSGFPGRETVRVTAINVPFWSIESFESLDRRLLDELSLRL